MNLKPFRKGEKERFLAKKKGYNFTSMVNALLNHVRDKEDGRTNMQRLAEVLLQMALKGDTKAAEIMLDRIDPKPKQFADISISTNVDVSPRISMQYVDEIRRGFCKLGEDPAKFFEVFRGSASLQRLTELDNPPKPTCDPTLCTDINGNPMGILPADGSNGHSTNGSNGASH